MTFLRILPLLALLGLPQAHAQVPAGDPTTAPIAVLDTALIGAMRSGPTTPFAQRVQALTPAVERAFDLQAVLRTAVGLRWSAIPDDQQAKLLTAFSRFTVATYAANFNSYDGQRFDLTGTRGLGSDQVVQTLLVNKDGSSTKLDYVMRQQGGTWRAVDVLLDGSISRAAVLRSDFRALLGGGDAGPLIANLQQKTDALAAGAQR